MVDEDSTQPPVGTPPYRAPAEPAVVPPRHPVPVAPALAPVGVSSAALILRIALGITFFAHGAQKVFGLFGGPGFSATIEHFQQGMNIAPVLAVLVMVAELLGAIGLLIGCLTRIAALGIVAVMVGAVQLVHWRNGFFMNWSGQQAGEGFEYHLLAISMALALVVVGGGRWSVDRLLRQNRQLRKQVPERPDR